MSAVEILERIVAIRKTQLERVGGLVQKGVQDTETAENYELAYLQSRLELERERAKLGVKP